MSYQIFRDPVPRQANGNIPVHFSELWIRPRTALGISFHRMDPRSLQEKMFSLNPTLSEVVHPRDHEGSCRAWTSQRGAKAKPSSFILPCRYFVVLSGDYARLWHLFFCPFQQRSPFWPANDVAKSLHLATARDAACSSQRASISHLFPTELSELRSSSVLETHPKVTEVRGHLFYWLQWASDQAFSHY